jgi:hypothetical protein
VISSILSLARLGQAWPGKPDTASEGGVISDSGKVVVKWSICMLMDMERAKPGHFRPQIDQNFTFHLLMRGDTAGQASTAHGTSTLARACPMVGAAGSTWLGCGREGQEYFHFQSIICHSRSDSAGSQDTRALCALPPTHHTIIMSRSAHNPSSL